MRQRRRAAAEVHRVEPRGEQGAFQLELPDKGFDVEIVLAVSPDDSDEVAIAAPRRAERQVDIKMTRPGHGAVTRRGRATSSPPQFGQTSSIDSAHATQNVHSKEQMRASPSGANPFPQRSQTARISRATVRFLLSR